MGREGGDRGIDGAEDDWAFGSEGDERDGRLTAMFFRVTRDCSTRR